MVAQEKQRFIGDGLGALLALRAHFGRPAPYAEGTTAAAACRPTHPVAWQIPAAATKFGFSAILAAFPRNRVRGGACRDWWRRERSSVAEEDGDRKRLRDVADYQTSGETAKTVGGNGTAHRDPGAVRAGIGGDKLINLKEEAR